jgi:outer membrane protein assembly factor BamB
MYRKTPTSPDELTIALNAGTGETIWEHKNAAPLPGASGEGWGGGGPNATPLVVANRLFVVGSHAMMNCLDKKTGEVLWSHDLTAEFGAPYPCGAGAGFAASPIAHENLVIVSAGRRDAANAPRGQALLAFDQATGRNVWKALDFTPEYSSPIVIRFGGQDQLIQDAPPGIVAVDPGTGQLLWTSPLNDKGSTPTPVFDGKDLLYFACERQARAGMAVRLMQVDGKTVPQVSWVMNRLRTDVATPVIIDSHLYGSTALVLYCTDLRTGELIWVERGYPRASCVHADGKLVILDENGKLTLATATPTGLTVHADHAITEKHSLTAPTLVGTTLYVRDRRHIIALDLGASA